MVEKLNKNAVAKKYCDAYKKRYGKSIGFYQRGSWFYLGKYREAYRLKQINKMADNLIGREIEHPVE